MSVLIHQQGHMKTHPGVLLGAPSKVQGNEGDAAEGQNSNSAENNPGQQGEKEGLVKSPEKGDDAAPQPTSVASKVADEPTDTGV